MLKKIRTETKEIICLGSIIFDTYWTDTMVAHEYQLKIYIYILFENKTQK